MGEKHDSDSAEQREAEQYVIKVLEKKFNIKLSSEPIEVTNGIKVQIDGHNQDNKIFIEVYSGIGSLKGGQSKKVITDAYKLLFVENSLFKETGCRKILCFIDENLLKKFQSKSWQSKSLESFNIEVMFCKIPEDAYLKLKKAKERQGKNK